MGEEQGVEALMAGLPLDEVKPSVRSKAAHELIELVELIRGEPRKAHRECHALVHDAHRVEVFRLVGRQARHARPEVHLRFDEALVLEQPECLAHRAAAHAIGTRHLHLRELRTRVQCTGEDAPA